ncbi:hypothetical protein [Mobilicoccus caccae]|uniref:Uncharacterized protein n=1 Tax=Mobilicoccus caccae TaxID=1859295 RepID=A0ABQ6ISE1_9MICO|nr:hypothetical protein [Mobilicoccus caccae]GMA40275.1 hypothetical protein GCM10025883_23200 [Mobilicoccus caccae]
MTARAIAHTWHDLGAVAVEAAPGLFVTAWRTGLDESGVRDLIDASAGDVDWDVLEIWEPQERTPAAIDSHLPR